MGGATKSGGLVANDEKDATFVDTATQFDLLHPHTFIYFLINLIVHILCGFQLCWSYVYSINFFPWSAGLQL